MARRGARRLTARIAAYYAPEPDDALLAAGNAWLGRDTLTGAPLPQPDLPDIAEVTADARVYGFHATLKPPMRLTDGAGWAAVREAAAGIAARTAPFTLPPLSVSDIDGFLALRETAPCPPLQALADACVAELDRFRAPPGEAELARRRRSGLTSAQDAMLVRWGSPYVFATWFFHLTLTRRLSAAEKPGWLAATRAHFAGIAGAPRIVSSLCLFAQREPGAPFVLAERMALRA
jgi:putative phosphonate metabolism protein